MLRRGRAPRVDRLGVNASVPFYRPLPPRGLQRDAMRRRYIVMVVKRVNIHDATKLSRYPAPSKGLGLSNRNRPVAEIRIGAARGQFVVPDSFFEPLPEEILEVLRGKR